jgi:hypothetical protein
VSLDLALYLIGAVILVAVLSWALRKRTADRPPVPGVLTPEDRAASSPHLSVVSVVEPYLAQALDALPPKLRDPLIVAYELVSEGFEIGSRNVVFHSLEERDAILREARTRFSLELEKVLTEAQRRTGSSELAEVIRYLKTRDLLDNEAD